MELKIGKYYKFRKEYLDGVNYIYIYNSIFRDAWNLPYEMASGEDLSNRRFKLTNIDIGRRFVSFNQNKILGNRSFFYPFEYYLEEVKVFPEDYEV